jgi:hypothetical protein
MAPGPGPRTGVTVGAPARPSVGTERGGVCVETRPAGAAPCGVGVRPVVGLALSPAAAVLPRVGEALERVGEALGRGEVAVPTGLVVRPAVAMGAALGGALAN